jgi:hypothetical protein
MNTTLIIDEYGKTARLIINKEDGIQVSVTDSFHRLRKWEVLIDKLDREFGKHTVLGEDTENYSYKTFEYLNGVWVHTEPFEFLIDIKNESNMTAERVKELVQSVGYDVDSDVDGYFIDINRLRIHTPF